MKPKNYKDLYWRKYPKDKPSADFDHYLVMRKKSKYSKYIKYRIDMYSTTQYETHNMSTTCDSLWKRDGVIYWMPLPDLPIN